MKHVYVDVINRFHMKSDIALLRYTCQLREGECKTKLGKPISVKREAEHDKCILF